MSYLRQANLESDDRRPILVTGAHRSGTTWLGSMLAAGGQAAYIHEPLNVMHSPGVMSTPVHRWYTYICEENEASFLPAFQRTLAYRYNLRGEIFASCSPSHLLRMGRDWKTFTSGWLWNLRPLLKDPFAVFSTAWFARKLNSHVVVAVRHPAAFASSLKRLGWIFQIEDLLAQPLLMRDWLEPYRAEMERVARGDAIGRAALLWKLIYSTLRVEREKNRGLILVRHEDLSLAPQEAFGSLYRALEMNFNLRAQRCIQASSSAENPSEIASAHSIHVNSRLNVHQWKHRLNAEEIDRVRRTTAGVVEHYYSDSSWQLEDGAGLAYEQLDVDSCWDESESVRIPGVS